MTDREKLIARLNASFKMQYSKRGLLTAQHTADDLIAYGVTFSAAVPGHDDKHNIAEMAYNNGYAKGLDEGKPKWIPVSEWLPDEEELVLIICKNGARFVGYYKRSHYNNEISWGIKTALNSTRWLNKGRVTHWMPLPEPPK